MACVEATMLTRRTCPRGCGTFGFCGHPAPDRALLIECEACDLPLDHTPFIDFRVLRPVILVRLCDLYG